MIAARVWVVGGTGMVGQAVCAALAGRGIDHVATGSQVDIAQADAVRAAAGRHRPSHIVNCAAMTAVDACEAEEARAQAVNGAGPGHLAAVARELGAAIAHISSDYVFAGDRPEPQDEAAPTGPKSAYGRSKLAGEASFLAAIGAGLPHVIVRTSWVFGPGGGNFVATMLRLMGEREAVQVVADQHGRPTYAPDLARALLDLLGLTGAATTRAKAAGIYHFANAGATTWHGLCAATLAAARAQGRALRCTRVEPVTSAELKRPAPRPTYSVLATHKVEQALGWAPQNFAPAVANYLACLPGG